MSLHAQLVLLLAAVCTGSLSIETICRKEVNSDMRYSIICKCNDIIQDFWVSEEFSYFEDAKYVSISNCREVILDSTDIYSTELEHLRLSHVHSTVFNVFLPSTISSLEIEDVGNLTGLPRHVFLHARYLQDLLIKNTHVQFIDSHTFSDILVRNVRFINTTFKYLKSNSLNFTGMPDGLHNSVFHIERCTFEELDSNSVSVRNIRTIHIIESEFRGTLKENTFEVSAPAAVLLRSNAFSCGKREDACDAMKFDIVGNLYQLSQHSSQGMCQLLQVNCCGRHGTTSLINSLQNCYAELRKYGVDESCAALEPDKGHAVCLNICLSLVCTLLLKVIL